MKIQLNVPQLFSMLTVFLIFSASFPSIATAQYDSIEAAKTVATADAKADTNKLAWFTTGLGCSILTLYLGGLAIDKHLSTFDPLYGLNSPDLDRSLDEINEGFAASLVGLGTAAFTATYWFSGIYQSSPLLRGWSASHHNMSMLTRRLTCKREKRLNKAGLFGGWQLVVV